MDRIWAFLMVRLAKWYHFKVACLRRSEATTKHMMGITRPMFSANHAGQLFDAGKMLPRLSCATFGLGFLLTQWAASC